MLSTIEDNQKGFAVIESLLVFIIVGLLGFTGWFVWHAKQSANESLSNAAASNPSTKKLSTQKDTTTPLADASTANTSSGSSATTSSKKSTAKPSTGTNSTSTNTSTSTQTQTQTPLGVLTAIIADLQKGVGDAKVTVNSITVPGPITDAQARPLVFTVNGQTYFAYRQGTPPNFDTSAAETAGTMAIVKATVSNPALISAYLDKTNKLTDPNFHQDGFSTGGN